MIIPALKLANEDSDDIKRYLRRTRSRREVSRRHVTRVITDRFSTPHLDLAELASRYHVEMYVVKC